MLATGSAKLNAHAKRRPHITPPISLSNPLPIPLATTPLPLFPTPLLRARTKISPLRSPPLKALPPPLLLQTFPMSLERMGNSLLPSGQDVSPILSVFFCGDAGHNAKDCPKSASRTARAHATQVTTLMTSSEQPTEAKK